MLQIIKKKLPRVIKELIRPNYEAIKIKIIQTMQVKYCWYTKKINQNKGDKQIIKIGFFIILGETWNSYAPLYEELKKHNEIQTTVFILPRYESGKLNLEVYNSTLNFLDKVNIKYVKAYNEKDDTWIPVSSLEFDYIFYSLPYKEQYFPTFRPDSLYKKTKICYIPYGFIFTKSNRLLQTVLSYDFFRYLYVFFASWNYVASYANNIYKKIGTKYHYVENLGFPRFDLNFPERKIDNKLFSILWTPRFAFGGQDPSENTSFFDFHKNIIYRIQECKDEYWIVRPHPLAFQTYIEKGIYTAEEIKTYIYELNNYENSELDDNKDYMISFGNSDVILADFSSLIVEYLMSGKPIIYCGKREAIPVEEIIDCMYCASSWSEVEKCIASIKSGEDPLLEKRIKLIEKINPEKNSSRRIVQFLLDDFKEGVYL